MKNYIAMYGQRGVALIQVLLLSALMGLLALQFTYTARDQIEAAAAMDQRVRAQLAADSALHIALFAELSYHVNVLNGYPEDWVRYQDLGVAGQWRSINSAVRISQLDITAKLPQRYPDHPLWPYLLGYFGYDRQQQLAILGEMADFQDADDKAWSVGREPGVTQTLFPYTNAPIQLPNTLSMALWSWPNLAAVLQQYSHHYANFSVNLAAADETLLAAISDAATARQLILRRNAGEDIAPSLAAMLRDKFPEEVVAVTPSTRRRWVVEVHQGELVWLQAVDVRLSALSNPPWQLIFRPSAPADGL